MSDETKNGDTTLFMHWIHQGPSWLAEYVYVNCIGKLRLEEKKYS